MVASHCKPDGISLFIVNHVVFEDLTTKEIELLRRRPGERNTVDVGARPSPENLRFWRWRWCWVFR